MIVQSRYGVVAALTIVAMLGGAPRADAQVPRYRAGPDNVFFRAPVEFVCEDGTPVPFDRYFVAFHAGDPNSYRALNFSQISEGYRLERGNVVNSRGRVDTTRPAQKARGSLIVVGYAEVNGEPRYFLPFARTARDKSILRQIDNEAKLSYAFRCQGEQTLDDGPDFFPTAEFEIMGAAPAGWQEELIKALQDLRSNGPRGSGSSLFLPVAVDGDQRPLITGVPIARYTIGQLISSYRTGYGWWNNLEALGKPLKVTVLPPNEGQIVYVAAARPAAPTTAAPSAGPGTSTAPAPRVVASAQKLDVLVQFNIVDVPFLQGQNSPKNYISSPSCEGTEAQSVEEARGRYKLLGCTLLNNNAIWIRVTGFEPERITTTAPPSPVANLPPLRVGPRKALPAADAGTADGFTISSQGGRFSDLVRQLIVINTTEVPQGCEPKINVSASALFTDRLSITKGECDWIEVPVPADLDPRPVSSSSQDYPRIVSGCLGQQQGRAYSRLNGSSLGCWIKQGADPVLTLVWTPAFRPLQIKARQLKEMQHRAQLFPQIPPTLSGSLQGGPAPVYEAAQARALDNLSRPICDPNGVALVHQGGGPALPSLETLGCRAALPRYLQLRFTRKSGAGNPPVAPSAAFKSDFPATFDLFSGAVTEPLPPAESLKLDLPVRLAGDIDKPDFRRQVGSIQYVENGDCSAGKPEMLTGSGPIPPGLPRKWPLKAAISTFDFKALTRCTEAEVVVDAQGPYLLLKFKAIREPGRRIVVVWTPSVRLNQAGRFETIRDNLAAIIKKASDEFRQSERRFRFDVLIGGANGNLDLLFSGESAAASPDEARDRLFRVPSDGPTSTDLSQLEGKLDYPLTEVAALVLIMDGDPYQEKDARSAARVANNVKSNPRDAGGPLPPVIVFLRQSCDRWKPDLGLQADECRVLEGDQRAAGELKRAIESLLSSR
jgi:hypothetical protein